MSVLLSSTKWKNYVSANQIGAIVIEMEIQALVLCQRIKKLQFSSFDYIL